MSKKKLSLLLAASIFLTGAAGTLGFITPANAITSVDELSDVDQNHWAYEALRDLVEKYDVIEGYPEGVFRGNRAPTRWELAAALNAVMKSVGRDLARLGAEKANKTDLQTLARLQEQFRNELAALQARTTALEGRASAIEAKNEEQDNRLTLLERTQLHGDASFGILSDISSQGTNAGLDEEESDHNGIKDGISAIGRLRLTMDIPVKEDNEDSYFGRGDIHARMIAAFGRISPNGAQSANGGAFSTFSGYSRIAGDADNVNNGQIIGGAGTSGNLRTNLYVENVHYKQHIKSGLPLLTSWVPGVDLGDGWETTGDFYVGVVPWRYLYDKSPYRGNELTQFQNTSFVNTPGVAPNYNEPMIAYAWHQNLGSSDMTADLTTSIGSVNVGDFFSGWNLSYEGRLNYNTSFLNLGWGKPGSVYAGGYHLWDSGNSSPYNALLTANTNRRGTAFRTDDEDGGTSAFYVGWNQEWYKGIGTTVNYLLSGNSKENLFAAGLNQTLGASNALGTEAIGLGVRQSLAGVLNIPMAAVIPGWRDSDALGVGYALMDFHEENIDGSTRFADGWENVVEAYYKWQVNDAISVVPSIQFITNRLGVQQNGLTTVFGLRTNFTF
ncbi:MAG: iron uptake porin [Candidatus Melainabacteria bacterium]